MQSRAQRVWEQEGQRVLALLFLVHYGNIGKIGTLFLSCATTVMCCRYWHVLLLGKYILFLEFKYIYISKMHLSGILMDWDFFHQSLLSGNTRGTAGSPRFYWQTAGAPYSRLQAENQANHWRGGEAGKEECLWKTGLSEIAASMVGKMHSTDQDLKC